MRFVIGSVIARSELHVSKMERKDAGILAVLFEQTTHKKEKTVMKNVSIENGENATAARGGVFQFTVASYWTGLEIGKGRKYLFRFLNFDNNIFFINYNYILNLIFFKYLKENVNSHFILYALALINLFLFYT